MPSKKEENLRFSVGDSVMGKWPMTSLYFKGTVIDLNEVEYLVKFDDEDNSELALKFKDVRNIFDRATRSRSRGRTPTRKSPSRKSPSRKSPSRKSPGRPAKEASSASPKKETNSAKKEETNAVEASPKKVVETNNIVTNRVSRSGTRQSARIASITEKSNDKMTNSIKVDVRSITKSLEDSKKLSARILNLAKRSVVCCWETSKVLPLAVLVLFIPFLFTQMCTKAKCTVLEFPDLPKRAQHYFDRKAIYTILGFTLAQFVLTFVPLGKVIQTPYGSKVRCNAFFAILVTFASVPIMMNLKFDVVSLYTLYYRHMLTTYTCMGVVFALLLYVKSLYARKSDLNPAGNSGYFLPDFIEGREVNPRVRTFDVKFFIFRMAFSTLIIVNLLIALKEFQTKSKNFNPTVIIACAFQIFYACDLMWFEEAFLSTFEYQKQGTGLMITAGYLAGPFYFSGITRYVMNHGPNYPWYCLIGTVVLNLVGYVIMRGSNSQKHAFRTNPSSPALSHLESVPTSAGSRLLVSGWWGIVRHPNYIGDLLVNLSWSFLCGFNHAFPWVLVGVTVLFMLWKVHIVESSCKKKYGLAWSSYTARVKYRLIPKVF